MALHINCKVRHKNWFSPLRIRVMLQMEPLIFVGHYSSISRIKLPHRQRRSVCEGREGGERQEWGWCKNRISWTLSAHALITCCRLATSKQTGNKQQQQKEPRATSEREISHVNTKLATADNENRLGTSRKSPCRHCRLRFSIENLLLRYDSDNFQLNSFNYLPASVTSSVAHIGRGRGKGHVAWGQHEFPVVAQ